MNKIGLGYSFLCPCGTILQTENGLDYADQLELLTIMVDGHRDGHQANLDAARRMRDGQDG